ncbi:hypothetical protein [Knoellia aerolata]|uniref:hypothetical protein n=1 Tax=Knoellia aerolata TaxID=442954 RepID=UPI000A5A87F3|nr:hypothetical protein [Knoellia aerolata]
MLFSIVVAVVILGPALGRGVVLAYDMVWSPDARLTPFATGIGTPAPRAVPSDALAWLAGLVLTPALAQKFMLVAVLVVASTGVVALLRHVVPDAGPVACSLAALAGVWNPFVSEHLVVGQWTVLLGYALLPWALRAAHRSVLGGEGRHELVLVLGAAGLGGVNTVLLVAAGGCAVLLAALATDVRRSAASLVLASVTVAAVSAVWALPALAAGAGVSSGGVSAFTPTADTPLGVWGSLVSGGGFWNAAAHPVQRDVPLVALTAGLLSVAAFVGFGVALRRTRHGLLMAPVIVGVGVVALSVLPFTGGVWAWLVTDVPGGGALRDSHKFLAAWVVATSVGVGVMVDGVRRRADSALAGVVSVVVLGLVVLLSSHIAWGVGGRLDAVQVPQGYRTAAADLTALPRGEVGLLPWNQYRRYEWNASRISLTLAPRIVGQRVLFDDSLPLRSGVVDGEDPRAAAVSQRISEGIAPVDAVRAAGVRYVAAELRTRLPVDQAGVRASGRVVVDRPDLLVVEVDDGAAGQAPEASWNVVGWTVTLLTMSLLALSAAVSRKSRRLLASLLRSPP